MVKTAQIHVKTIRKNFLKPPLSAIAPRIGERIATIIADRAIEFAHIVVPKFSSEAITFIKNALYIKVTTIVVKGWFAKSYNDHANTSFLFSSLCGTSFKASHFYYNVRSFFIRLEAGGSVSSSF